MLFDVERPGRSLSKRIEAGKEVPMQAQAQAQARARNKVQSRIVQRSGTMKSFPRSIASRGPILFNALKRREAKCCE
jgi:hypothetical protein